MVTASPCCAAHSPDGATAGRKARVFACRNVGIRYRDHEWALREVSFDVWQGDVLALVGPNGAGKSSLLRAIAGLQKVEEGEILWDQHASRSRVGYVPQQQRGDQTVPLEVIELLLLNRGLGGSHRARQRAAIDQLDELGVGHLASRLWSELSGGELQRVMLAYALLNRPEVLLLDEPMTGVDLDGGSTFLELMNTLHRERQLTVVMISHDLHLVRQLAQVVVCLNRRICCTGTPEHVLQDHVLAGVYREPHTATPEQRRPLLTPAGPRSER